MGNQQKPKVLSFSHFTTTALTVCAFQMCFLLCCCWVEKLSEECEQYKSQRTTNSWGIKRATGLYISLSLSCRGTEMCQDKRTIAPNDNCRCSLNLSEYSTNENALILIHVLLNVLYDEVVVDDGSNVSSSLSFSIRMYFECSLNNRHLI